jgi:SAM-dependent methyltransferase
MNWGVGVKYKGLTFTTRGGCPGCGKPREAQEPKIRFDSFSVYACACGLKYLDPALDDASQIAIYEDPRRLREMNPALEEYYDFEVGDLKTKTGRDYARALASLGTCVGGRDLMEIGCGAGGFLAFAKSRGWNVLGVDSGAQNIQKTRDRGVEAVCADVFAYRPSRSFDAVVLWDVLEHPLDPGKLIRKCREFLKPGGCLLIALPYDPNLISLLATVLYRVSFSRMRRAAGQWYVPEHNSYFSERGLRSLLGRNGFDLIRCWKTDTDLSRYRFGVLTRICLEMAFAAARLFGLQNRMILIAKVS